MPTQKVSMTAYVCTGVINICSCGIFICNVLPFKVLCFCWTTQCFFLCFPFRCVRRIISLIKDYFCNMFNNSVKQNQRKLLRYFFGCDLDDKEMVLRTMSEIRSNSAIAIGKMNLLNHKLGKCQKQLYSCKTVTKRLTKEIVEVAREEKRLISVVIGALKHLRGLKCYGEVVDRKYKNKIQNGINTSNKLSEREFSEQKYKHSISEHNLHLKDGYNELLRQAEKMREIVERKRMSFDLNSEDARYSYAQDKKTSRSKLNTSSEDNHHTNMQIVTIGTEALRTIVGLLNTKNIHLERCLEFTNGQLCDVRHAASSLNEKISDLERQLNRVTDILMTVQADRDSMRTKLLTLEGMIEEEEVYLNDDNSSDSSYNELYFTSREFHLNNLDE